MPHKRTPELSLRLPFRPEILPKTPKSMGILQSICSFLSVVVIAWITQRIITHWDKRKKIAETKLATYLSWIPSLADCYARAFFPDESPHDAKEFLKKKVEILGILQIMGPSDAIDAAVEFFEMAERGLKKDASFDRNTLHHCYTELNCCLCCEIHGEKHNNENAAKA